MPPNFLPPTTLPTPHRRSTRENTHQPGPPKLEAESQPAPPLPPGSQRAHRSLSRRSKKSPAQQEAPKEKDKKEEEHTAAGILRSSPTPILLSQYSAYVRQSGRVATYHSNFTDPMNCGEPDHVI